MNTKNTNSFILQHNGVKVVTATAYSILTKTKRIRVGDETPAYAYFVCGFHDSIDNYERFGMSPHVIIYKTESEVQEYCKDKVVSYKEYHVDTEQEIDELVANNKALQESHKRSLREVY